MRCETTHPSRLAPRLSTVLRVIESRVAPAGGQSPSHLPVKGQRGGDHFRDSALRTLVLALCFFGLRFCFLSCARPPNICHLFSVKFSCKVSQCVVPENQHVKLSGWSQFEFSSFIHMLVSQEGSGSLGGKASPFPESRCEMKHWKRSEDSDMLSLFMMTTCGV